MRALIGLLIGAMMAAAAGCATAPPPPAPSVDVSGNWIGTWAAFEGTGGSGDLRGSFAQSGATLYGNFEIITGSTVNRTFVSGTVAGNQVELTAPATGILTVTGNEMSGVVQGLVHSRVMLRKQP